MIKAITHIHTSYSYDCLVTPRRIVDRLAAAGVGLALVADHDTFAGSVEARRHAAESGAAVFIPLAAEIWTEWGDVILILDAPPLPDPASLRAWSDLQAYARSRGGLLWLPHPWSHHSHQKELAAGADVIEVFNARSTDEENAKAEQLCRRLGKTPGWGTDGHTLAECLATIVEYPGTEASLATLRSVGVCPVRRRTASSAVCLSQAVKGFRRARPGLLFGSIAMACVEWMRETCRAARRRR
jgi:hypothetical protein